MPVDLIDRDEKLIFKFDDAEIYYRRVPPLEKAAVIKRHTIMGTVDYSAVGVELCKKYCFGWKNFRMKGKEVAFDPSYFEVFPDEVLTPLYQAMVAANVEGIRSEEVEKN